ncbi:MAG: proline dehydrogenase family protein [Candidatus Yanofskybacteria bacterium]|nr:proline dehydrogenase family protein [Candidatus Yanofskybacteria bacterium]
MKTSILAKTLLFLPRKIFIAGKTREEVLKTAARLNGEGFLATIDVLGEHSKNEEEAEEALLEYKELINEITGRGLRATISIKLTHLGLELGFGYCFNIIRKLAAHARQCNIGIEFDMEEFKYNPEIIEIFQDISSPPGNNRICLQANIKNSFENFEILHDSGHPIRFVRGAYEESSRVSFQDQEDIQETFMSLIHGAILKTILNKLNGISSPKHAIATRDKKIVEHVKRFVMANALTLDKNCIEFQLLYGYLSLGRELLQEGYPVRIYLPYGNDQVALPYIWRRLKTPHAWRLLLDWLLSSGKISNKH